MALSVSSLGDNEAGFDGLAEPDFVGEDAATLRDAAQREHDGVDLGAASSPRTRSPDFSEVGGDAPVDQGRPRSGTTAATLLGVRSSARPWVSPLFSTWDSLCRRSHGSLLAMLNVSSG